MPCTVFDTLECRYWQQVTILSVDRTNNFVDECRDGRESLSRSARGWTSRRRVSGVSGRSPEPVT
jgi:hypothetical protein